MNTIIKEVYVNGKYYLIPEGMDEQEAINNIDRKEAEWKASGLMKENM